MELVFKELLNYLDIHLDWIENAVTRLPEEALWKRLRPGTNSIGNLCLHLAGNERHYIGHGVGGLPDVRDRPGEFNAVGGVDREALLKSLRDSRATTRKVLDKLTVEDFQRKLHVDHPEYPTALNAVIHVVEHYAYHSGQIVLMARVFQDGDERILPWGH